MIRLLRLEVTLFSVSVMSVFSDAGTILCPSCISV